MGWNGDHRHHYGGDVDHEVVVPFLERGGIQRGQARLVTCACGAVGWRVIPAHPPEGGHAIALPAEEPDF